MPPRKNTDPAPDAVAEELHADNPDVPRTVKVIGAPESDYKPENS